MSTIPTPTLFAAPSEVIDRLPWEPLPGCVGVTNKVVFTDDGTVAGLLRLRPGAQETAHLHEHGQHHVWVLEGTVMIEDTELAQGSYLHVPEHLVHAVSDTGEGSLLFYLFQRDR
jgi:quercetin dioxygenase-like cupin family protein